MATKGAKQYEKNLVSRSVRYLKSINCSLVEKRHAGAFRRGKADLTGALTGLRFEFEAKVGSNKLTDLQKKWLEKCKMAGCLCAGFWTLDELKWIISNYENYYVFTDTGSYIDLPLDDGWRLLEKYRSDN